MTENRIGTDSTIHIHIQTLLERDYVTKEKGEFEPTRLGLALVAAHKEVASELCEVDLRARMEETVRGIEDGKIDGEQKLKEDLKGF
jgi:DNA topoisomerase IA